MRIRMIMITSLICMLGIGAFVGVKFAFSQQRQGEYPSIQYWIKRLGNPEKKLRLQAYRELIKRRKQIVKMLIETARKGKQARERLEDGKRELAIRLLGEMRAIEAVDFLIEDINFKPQKAVLSDYQQARENKFPCVGALINIGYPSVEGILRCGFRKERNKYEQMLMAYVIRRVFGRGEVEWWEVGTEIGRGVIEGYLKVRGKYLDKVERERLKRFMDKYFEVK